MKNKTEKEIVIIILMIVYAFIFMSIMTLYGIGVEGYALLWVQGLFLILIDKGWLS